MDDLTHTSIPGSAAPDFVGAFRFICFHTTLSYDDPIVYYGQTGVSHLHDETGVDSWTAFSNYGNLRTGGGGSNCNYVEGADGNAAKRTHSANRTPYWQTALLDGKGNVILVDDVAFYYKRRPASDPKVSNPAAFGYVGQAVELPNGIKFVFGNKPSNPSAPFDGHTKYICTSSSADFGSNMRGALAACQGSSGQFEVRSESQDCWNGVDLDSADHRSHVAYGYYDQNSGQYRCPVGYPYVIPQITYGAQYTIAATDDVTLIHFSSDEMDLTKPQGWSFHVDYGPAAWDPVIKAMWHNGCINQLLNCSGGDMGNGFRLKGAAQPIYLSNGVYTPYWRNPVRLVPVPARP